MTTESSQTLPDTLAGKVIAITGAASGIGRTTSQLLAKLKAKVSLADINGNAVEQVAKELTENGAEVFWKQVDVRNRDQVEEWVCETVATFGRPLDGAANLAGIAGHFGPVRHHEPANYEAVFGINVGGIFNCMSAQLRNMRHADADKGITGGSIVNAASITGLVGKPNISIYCASKSAVIGMTKAAAREETESGIRINAIAPGFVQTPMMEKVDHDLGFQLPNEAVLGRRARPEEIASVIQFLLSDASSYVTGSVYQIDGGMIC